MNENLSEFQRESIRLFVRAASAVSFPKSLGEIYGLLFSTEQPLALDDITERLKMSRGSAFEGVRALRSLGAVHSVHVPGIRKEHFTAETSLRKLASGFLRDQVEPHVENGSQHLDGLRRALISHPDNTKFASQRVGQIERWHRFLKKSLPLIKSLAGKF